MVMISLCKGLEFDPAPQKNSASGVPGDHVRWLLRNLYERIHRVIAMVGYGGNSLDFRFSGLCDVDVDLIILIICMYNIYNI